MPQTRSRTLAFIIGCCMAAAGSLTLAYKTPRAPVEWTMTIHPDGGVTIDDDDGLWPQAWDI